jgi:hypothetical protein
VDEEFWDVGCEEAVAGFGAGDDGADGDVLVVEHEVLDEETFAGVTAADEDDDGALVFVGPKADGAHVKFGEFQVHGINCVSTVPKVASRGIIQYN